MAVTSNKWTFHRLDFHLQTQKVDLKDQKSVQPVERR